MDVDVVGEVASGDVVLNDRIIKDLHITAISRHPFLKAILRCFCYLGLVLVAGNYRRPTLLLIKLIFKGFTTSAIRVRLTVEWMNEIKRSCF